MTSSSPSGRRLVHFGTGLKGSSRSLPPQMTSVGILSRSTAPSKWYDVRSLLAAAMIHQTQDRIGEITNRVLAPRLARHSEARQVEPGHAVAGGGERLGHVLERGQVGAEPMHEEHGFVRRRSARVEMNHRNTA